MSVFLVCCLLVGISLFIALSEWRRRRRFRKSIRQAWGSRQRLAYGADSESSLYESFLLDLEELDYDSLLDDQTWSDLDFARLFQEMDAAALSSLGSEALYSRLRLWSFKEDEDFEQLQAYLSQHPDQREQLQYLFAQIGKKNHNHAKKLIYEPVPANHRFLLYSLLASLPLLSPLLMPLNFQLGVTILIASMVFNISYSMATRWSLGMRLEEMSYLVRVLYTGQKIARYPLPGQQELKSALKPFGLVRYFGGVFRPQTGVSELEIFYLYINSVLLIPHLAQAYLSKGLARSNQEARQVLAALGRLEAAIAVLNYKTSLPQFCRPDFSRDRGICGSGLYHPLLDEPVSNPLDFTRNIMISGDNASGKSTYLRTAAVNAVLAQALGFACGESFSLAYGHVMTAMDVSDDINSGDSYFIAESRAIKRMLESLEDGGVHYFFIDELFKGTNTVERIGAGLSIISWLAQRDCLYMISSHDVELVATSGSLNCQYHFDSQYINGEIVFDYRLKPGSALTKNAVHTLASLAYPTEITAQAQAIIQRYEETGQWQL